MIGLPHANAHELIIPALRLNLSGYKSRIMRAEARFFKSLSDETRLKILWLLSRTEELCVCDIIQFLKSPNPRLPRHLRYLYHLGWFTDRRDGLWMNYRLCVSPGSAVEKLLKLLKEMLAPQPEVQALRGQLACCLKNKRHSQCAMKLNAGGKGLPQGLPKD